MQASFILPAANMNCNVTDAASSTARSVCRRFEGESSQHLTTTDAITHRGVEDQLEDMFMGMDEFDLDSTADDQQQEGVGGKTLDWLVLPPAITNQGPVTLTTKNSVDVDNTVDRVTPTDPDQLVPLPLPRCSPSGGGAVASSTIIPLLDPTTVDPMSPPAISTTSFGASPRSADAHTAALAVSPNMSNAAIATTHGSITTVLSDVSTPPSARHGSGEVLTLESPPLVIHVPTGGGTTMMEWCVIPPLSSPSSRSSKDIGGE